MALVFVGLLMPTVATANPVVNQRDQVHQGMVFGLVALSLFIEVVVTALILKWICQVERRLSLVAALTLLNLATFTLFVFYLHPMIGSVIVTELAIWPTEAFGIMHITRLLSEQPATFRTALAVAFLGNLFSFLVGLAG